MTRIERQILRGLCAWFLIGGLFFLMRSCVQ